MDGAGRSTGTPLHLDRGRSRLKDAGRWVPRVPTVLPVFLVAFVMIAFIGVPVFMSWWHNRGT